ncbi:MAG: SusC/RagA family TonB-linked outer membrane protein, partial [Prevotellaceae bacterium]|nr:SusC/RagA family TonB-linked outer membrane protein [Prevotellaceae bacterium]
MQKQADTLKIGRWLAMAAMSFLAVCTYAQTQVSGVVKNNAGEPIIGATVVAEGTTVAAMTDENGRYTINVSAGITSLTVSFLGMKTQTVPVTGSVVDVTLQEEATILTEVVMIGYGSVKKRDLTGAVSSVGAKTIAAIPISSAAEALVGKMAGVQVVSTEGSPDAEIKIRVRGGGSITQDNSPLYIVDGFPVSNLNAISPNDIATVDVLKDASSTAIYGARGANGVIIVTTKTGTPGRTTVNFTAYAGVKNITRYLDVLNPYEFALSQAEIIGADNNDYTKFFGEFGDIDLYNYQQAIDWQKELFGRTAITQSYNLSITGGNEATTYNLSLSRNAEEGVMLNSGFERTNLNFNMKTKLNDRMNVTFNVRLANTGVDGPGLTSSGSVSTGRLKNALQFRPTLGIASFSDNVDPSFLEDMETSSQLYDPVETANDDYQSQSRLNTAYNGAFDWTFIPNLKYRLEVGY